MSVKRGTFDIIIYYADDDYKRLEFTTENDSGNTVPHALTVYDKIRMQAKSFRSFEAEPLVTWTVGDGLAIEGGADNNVLQISLEWPRTEPLQGGQEYPFDLRFLQGGELNTLLEGTITSQESITTR
jgi:hypothetical protein